MGSWIRFDDIMQMDNRDPRYDPPDGGCAILIAPLMVACAMVFGVFEVVLLTKDPRDIHSPIFTAILTFFVTFFSSCNWVQTNSKKTNAGVGKAFGIVGVALIVALLVYAGSMVVGSAIVAPACSSH